MSYRGWTAAGIGILLASLVLVRSAGLLRYPAPSPDEGFWTAGAKNAVLFHEPLMDRRLHPFLSPATFVSLVVLFEVVGPGLLAARACSATVGLVGVGLIWLIGRRVMPGRPWLLALVFGMSSMVVLENRRMMIETQQLAWLIALALLWLRPGLRSAAGAGFCLALALLTKSNSVYVVPALIWSAGGRDPAAGPGDEARDRASPRSRVVVLGLVAGAVAGLGYLATYAIDPGDFRAAYKFEVDGQHFLSDRVVFHIGRFGLNPAEAGGALIALVKGDPFWVALAPFGLLLAAGRRWEDRADRLFGSWLIVGLLFFLSQIYIAPRYLVTLAPAFAYFAARALDAALDAKAARWPARPAALGLLALFLGYHGGRLALGIRRDRGGGDYAEAVRWVARNVPAGDRVIAAPYVGISLAQRSYDPFRMTRAYGEEDRPRPLADVVREREIRALVVDDEVRQYLTAGDEAYLRDDCPLAATFGSITIHRPPIAPGPPGRPVLDEPR